jgi:hypothetical protein
MEVAMRALIIGAEEKAAITTLIALAGLNPISADDLRAAMTVEGDDLVRWKQRLDPFTMELPIGFMVTYTHEHQPPGLCHHISISIDAMQKVPNQEAIAMICTAFGMSAAAALVQDPETKSDLVIAVWPEEYDTGHVAINIVELVQ